MKYNKDLHHRHSIRLQNYDYANTGAYFVTMCCKNRVNYFGKIENEKMILNEYGNVAYDELVKTSEIRTNVKLCEFVVMPDHIHAIIQITENMGDNGGNGGNNNGKRGVCNTPLQQQQRRTLQSPSNTVGAIIRGYKSTVSKQIRDRRGVLHTPIIMGHTPQIMSHTPQISHTPQSIWQRNYYEHIIRNETEYTKIVEYIRNNPILWGKKHLNEILQDGAVSQGVRLFAGVSVY